MKMSIHQYFCVGLQGINFGFDFSDFARNTLFCMCPSAWIGNCSATMLAAKRSADVAPEVNLNNVLHACEEARKTYIFDRLQC